MASIRHFVSRHFLGTAHESATSGGSIGAGELPVVLEIDNTTLERRLNAKTFDKLYHQMNKIVKFLHNPRVNLKQSPPYILDTLPDIYQRLQRIWEVYEHRLEELAKLEHFRVFLLAMENRCAQLNQMIKTRKEELFDESSETRRFLNKMSINLSYMFEDLKTFFPEGEYRSEYKITKKDAEEWWTATFPNKIIVSWKTFRQALNQVHRIESQEEARALKSGVDITCNDYVSIFEFDIFTRLFAPWNNLLNNWKVLAVKHPAYADLTYEEVRQQLLRDGGKAGTYLFRRSCTKLGFWSIGYVTKSEGAQAHVHQTVVKDGKTIVRALIEGRQQGYYLYPNGQPEANAPDLTVLESASSETRFQVTEEQFEIYCEMGSTFQLCKICAENDKDVKLEPCGHLMCTACLKLWTRKQAQQTRRGKRGEGCPFCRADIRSAVPIVVDPFNPRRLHERDDVDMESLLLPCMESSVEIITANGDGASAKSDWVAFADDEEVLIGATAATSIWPSSASSAASTEEDNNNVKVSEGNWLTQFAAEPVVPALPDSNWTEVQLPPVPPRKERGGSRLLPSPPKSFRNSPEPVRPLPNAPEPPRPLPTTPNALRSLPMTPESPCLSTVTLPPLPARPISQILYDTPQLLLAASDSTSTTPTAPIPKRRQNIPNVMKPVSENNNGAAQVYDVPTTGMDVFEV